MPSESKELVAKVLLWEETHLHPSSLTLPIGYRDVDSSSNGVRIRSVIPHTTSPPR